MRLIATDGLQPRMDTGIVGLRNECGNLLKGGLNRTMILEQPGGPQSRTIFT